MPSQSSDEVPPEDLQSIRRRAERSRKTRIGMALTLANSVSLAKCRVITRPFEETCQRRPDRKVRYVACWTRGVRMTDWPLLAPTLTSTPYDCNLSYVECEALLQRQVRGWSRNIAAIGRGGPQQSTSIQSLIASLSTIASLIVKTGVLELTVLRERIEPADVASGTDCRWFRKRSSAPVVNFPGRRHIPDWF